MERGATGGASEQFEGRLQGPRGLRLRTWSGTARPRGSLLLLNGVMSHTSWMRPVGLPLARRGIRVVGYDRPGTGLNRHLAGGGGAPPILRDLRCLAEAERESAGGRVWIGGWCWGAAPALLAAAEMPELLSRLVLLTPGLWPSAGVRERMREEMGRAGELAPDRPDLRSPIPEEMFTTGPELEGFIRRDADRTRRLTPRQLWELRKVAAAALRRLSAVSQPVLVCLGRRDAAVDNDGTVHALREALPAVPHIEWLDTAHGVQFEAPEPLAERVAGWLTGAGSA